VYDNIALFVVELYFCDIITSMFLNVKKEHFYETTFICHLYENVDFQNCLLMILVCIRIFCIDYFYGYLL